MKAKIVVIADAGRVELPTVELPPVRWDRVLLRPSRVGICASDLDVYGGRAPQKLPMYVGHEFGGVVEELGEGVTNVAVGDRVAVWTPGTEGPGTFGLGELAVVGAGNCIKAPAAVTDLGTVEPLACCVNSVELANPRFGDDIVIVGAGYMGLLLTRLSALRGPRSITVAARRPYQLELAKKLGATNIVQLHAGDDEQHIAENVSLLQQSVREHTGGSLAHVAYEVTGSQAGINYSGNVLKTRGTWIDVGYHQGRGGLRTHNRAHVNGMGFRTENGHYRPDDESGFNPNLAGFHSAMRLLGSGRLDLSDFPIDTLVTNNYALHEAPEAFARAAERHDGDLKTVFDLGQNLLLWPGPATKTN